MTEGQVTPAGYLGTDDDDLDDQNRHPLRYHKQHHGEQPIAKCDDEGCKNYTRMVLGQ